MIRRGAALLAKRGVSPNTISLSSVFFGIAAACALAATSRCDAAALRITWLTSALCVVLRLLANVFDGMVAIEHGKRSLVGALYNEVPDRFSDAAILIGAGYASGSHPVLGFVAALLATTIAYVRAVGASIGAGDVFIGPMAKPHRMAAIIAAAVYCAVAPRAWQPTHSSSGISIIGIALVVIVVGGAWTIARRLSRIAATLRRNS